MKYKTDKEIENELKENLSEFVGKLRYLQIYPTDEIVKDCISLKNFILSQRKQDREAIRGELKAMRCQLPKKKMIDNSGLSEKNVNQLLLYSGRFNYNKALSDLLSFLDGLEGEETYEEIL